MRRFKKIIPYIIIVLVIFSGLHRLDMQVLSLENEVDKLKSQEEDLHEELQLQKSTYEMLLGNSEKEIAELKGHIEHLKAENESIKTLKAENENLRTIRAKLTAYSPYENVDGQQAEGDPSRTSIGKKTGKNIVAADPKKLPYGTIIDIPGWGEVEVGDTGGALRRDNRNIRLDLFHDTHSEAMAFGVQDKEVKIIKWGGEQ